MKLSLIVITTDRTAVVKRLFASLSVQSSAAFHIVLVHGPGLSTEAAGELAYSFPNLDITILQSADTCLSRSRNLALAAATGDIIALADDDCVYEPDTVAEVLSVFTRYPDIHIIMGRSFDIAEVVNAKNRGLTMLGRYAVFKDCPSYVHFYKADVPHIIGTFDEELGVGCDTPFQSGEETDYVLRALAAGFRVARASSITVRHPAVDPRNPAAWTKATAYAAGRMRVLRKHRLPCWFVLANILYPLLRLPLDCLRECFFVTRYRWAMFTARLKWLKDAK